MMKSILLFIIVGFTLSGIAQYNYPMSKTVDSSDTYFGVRYPDPFRWLENMKDSEVKNWFKSQGEFTNEIINNINGCKELQNEWENLSKLKSTKYSDRYERGNKIFFVEKKPGTSPKLYFKEKGASNSQLLLDPETSSLEKDVEIQSCIPSFDGKKVVITFMKSGAEISTIKIFDVDTKQFLSDVIYPCFSSIFWYQDNNAFIYTSLVTDDNTSEKFLKNNKIKLHIIGNDSKNDIDIFSSESHPELGIKPYNFPNAELTELSPDYLFSSVGNDDGLNIYYVASSNEQYSKHINWKSLSKAEDQLVKSIDFKGNLAYAMSNKNAPNFKLIATTISDPNWNNAEVIAAERKDLILDNFSFCKDYIVLTYSDGINSRLFKYDLKTKNTTEIKLPYIGNISLWCPDRTTYNCYFKIKSWNKPSSEFKLNALTNEINVSEYHTKANFPAVFDSIEVEEIEIKGHDGTLIPLSIIYKKGMKMDGKNYCLMDSYGAYGYSSLPFFDPIYGSLISKGIIFAIPHVRGGGEKGEAWRIAGYKGTKPNTWKDFNSCAEYLIAKKYTSSKKIIASSGSAGGIMIGRAITEKPDLYGAAICISGVVNTMRSEQMPNGQNFSFEIGSTKNADECKSLFVMDAVAHVESNKQYPAIICATGINDPRVSPWQSAKLIAAFQQLNPKGKPSLLMVNYDGGHFSSDQEMAAQIAFALWQCGHPNFQLKN